MASLTELLAKDSDALDPAHVINISSTSSVSGFAEGSLSAAGSGTWSCKHIVITLDSIPHSVI